jgi:carbonic anhydrase
LKQWFTDIPANVFSGFIVSLIALPLSLGLALAAGIPPIAGIIAAVVGGVVVSIIGGSYVTVAGPGNGLVVATLSAVMLLGEGDMQQGYLLTLAAVVVSGVLILLFGVFRIGIIGEYFPSAAVQGMLAAIGLIIVSKQLHILLGVINPDASSAVGLYALFPDTLSKLFEGSLNPLPWIIGLGALSILILHTFIKEGIFKKIPAPVLAVGFAIGANYMAKEGHINYEPLAAAFLIQLPGDILGQLAFPDFSKVGTYAFFSAVFSLTFIATTETLLSIKAVDKLDPQRRRSNINKDLRAVGLATVFSGMLGGMNPVIAIARSSVNVNNGGTWRSANFFHAMFLAIFVLGFSQFLNQIPLPALAAILVFTGYRLASPRVFRKIAQVGYEQLLIFVVTLLITLFTDLIMGMASGILLTLILQILSRGRANIILRNFFKPNTLLYLEESGKYHLSVRAYSNFTNFRGLKKNLDSVPPGADVVVDFSLSQFVDYSVLEQISGYADYFEKFNGSLEIIGLDDLTSRSGHPLAPRKNPSRLIPNRNTQRQETIIEFFNTYQWDFVDTDQEQRNTLLHFRYFADKTIEQVRNGASKSFANMKFTFTDVDFHEGELLAQRQMHTSVVVIKLDRKIPVFIMDKENLLSRVSGLMGLGTKALKEHPDFIGSFNVKGNDEQALRSFFTNKLVAFFEEHKPYHIESYENQLLIFEKERSATISEFKQLIRFVHDLSEMLKEEE